MGCLSPWYWGKMGQRLPENPGRVGKKSEALNAEADEGGGSCVELRVRWSKIPGL